MLTDLNMPESMHSPLLPTQYPRKSGQRSPAVRAEYTRDKKLIGAYRELRQRLYAIDERFVGFRLFNTSHAEDYEDPDNQMILLHDGTNCYGGTCLRVSSPEHPVMLDLENDIRPAPGKFYFSLKEHFPDMGLEQYNYAEATRITIDPQLRQLDATRLLFRAILERCNQQNVRYMFGIGDRIRIRLYRQILLSMGVDGGIESGTNLPMHEEYEGVKMYLFVWHHQQHQAALATQDSPNINQPE